MLFSCVGAGIDAITDDSETVPFADETPVAPVGDTNAADAEATPAPEATPIAAAPVENNAELPLFDRLMACTTAEQFKAVAEAAGEDAVNALSESELAALEKHYGEIYVPVMPETVVFTDAGPFMPAVSVASRARMMLKAAPASERATDNGLVTSKTATKLPDGNYKITIEAYATGEVKTETSTTPVDIVLVLDQSRSMAYNFNGDSTSTNSARRQYAMKQAVNSFISAVAGKYVSSKSDHRMAIVTFGSGAKTLQGWTFVNDAGKSTLQGKIDRLPDQPSGATNVAAGMTQAEYLMGSGYNYNGANTQRHKVVIMFTDGVPTTSTEFDKSVANDALNSAKNLKDKGATIYSVGIFNGAEPSELYGEKWEYTIYSDIICSGNVGSYWGGSWLSSIRGKNDFDSLDVPAVNRFLNYVSNNFASADEIGITKANYNPGNHLWAGGTGWRIDGNFPRTASNYYLTADNADSLNKIFTQISENIGSTNVTLDSKAVVRDVVTEYFEMPANTSDISVKTYDCNSYNKTTGEATWKNEKALSNAVSIDGNTVDVTGFDFKANYVRDKATDDGNGLGKKLVIEFTVTPKDGFAGGNNVPTNESESGIYENKDAATPVDTFEIPTVNVPVIAPALTAKDSNIYYDGSVPTAKAMCNSYDTNSYLFDFVNVSYDLDKAVSNTADGSYTVTATVEPKEKASSTSVGSEATAKTASASAKVNVFKPEITFNDSAIDLGDTANYTDNGGTVVWKHGATSAETVTMTGSAPTLTFSYDPIADAFKVDTYVNVNVKNGDKDITNAVTFKHDTCNFDKCSFDAGKGEFIVHIKTFDLTISKKGWDTVDENQSFVFRIVCADKGVDMQVTVIGNGSVTVKGLPVGTYKITEDTAWAWRYNLQGVASDGTGTIAGITDGCTYTPNGTNNSIVFTNSRIQYNWLSFVNYVKNVFGMKDA